MILADVIETETVYGLGRAGSLDGWWAWVLLILVSMALLWFATWMVRRDSVELQPAMRWSLLLLRVTAITCLVVFFLAPERRAQQRELRPSELAVIVDNSQSMTMPAQSAAARPTRFEALQQLLRDTPLMDRLADRHLITMYTTTDSGEPREVWTYGQSQDDTEANAPAAPTVNNASLTALARIAVGGLAIGLLCFAFAALFAILGRSLSSSRGVLAAVVVTIISGVLLGTAVTVAAPIRPTQLLSGTLRQVEPSQTAPPVDPQQSVGMTDLPPLQIDSASTRLGDAIDTVLKEHDPQTLAGIVLLTEGQNNAGQTLEDAGRQAASVGVPLYPIGFGSADPIPAIRWVDLEVPPRVYPGDRFQIAATLQATGLESGEFVLELREGAEEEENSLEESNSGELLEVKRLQIGEAAGDESGLLTARFELEPEGVGRRRLNLKIVGEPDWQIESPVRTARYEIVNRRTRVLIVAGGPTREYRFLRNLLYREKDVTLDVWLQSGQAGMSQEADNLLQAMPSTAAKLFEYDAVVMFDPDLTEIPPAAAELLARWVADQAGGLLVVAGPVNMPRWTRRRNDDAVETLLGLLPVAISPGSLLLDDGRFEGREPWPLEFTAAGEQAAFLMPADDPQQSQAVWETFGGVYGYYSTDGPKPGATVYARFSDPTTRGQEGLPVFLASQFYGGGRVFFLGSGEMWRLRSAGDQYFDSLYIKLIRWISEGRLLRDSMRGILLVDQTRAMVGDTITIRAILADAQFQPLTAPSVDARIIGPDGIATLLRLNRLEGQPREGTYSGTWAPPRDGNYEIEIELQDAVPPEILSRSVQVRLPTRELEHPQRNDTQLTAVAEMTDGQYLLASGRSRAPAAAGAAPSAPRSVPQQLARLIEPRSMAVVLPGTPDRDFQLFRNAVLMILVAGALLLEWLLRRLHRLA